MRDMLVNMSNRKGSAVEREYLNGPSQSGQTRRLVSPEPRDRRRRVSETTVPPCVRQCWAVPGDMRAVIPQRRDTAKSAIIVQGPIDTTLSKIYGTTTLRYPWDS